MDSRDHLESGCRYTSILQDERSEPIILRLGVLCNNLVASHGERFAGWAKAFAAAVSRSGGATVYNDAPTLMGARLQSPLGMAILAPLTGLADYQRLDRGLT